MSTDVRPQPPRGRSARRLGASGLVVAVLAGMTGCSGDSSPAADPIVDDRPRPERAAPPPTLTGGIELEERDPATVLIGADLAFGAALPSRQLAAQAYTSAPEVATASVRAVYEQGSGRPLGEVLVLSLVGGELFDVEALAAFEQGIVRSLSGRGGTALSIAGWPARHATHEAGGVVSFREGNLLVVVTAPADDDAMLVATRVIEARQRGEAGTGELATPLPATPVDAVFVPVPTVSFLPFSPPEEEPTPEAPSLSGATSVQGRYGVVAGERRSVVWAFTVDPAAHPTAESLDPALRDLATARTAGAAAEPIEVVDRVVHAATSPVGEPSARVFRHEGLVLLVEGPDPAQLDAVVTAWITALAAT